MKNIPNGVKKYLRNGKARIRKEISNKGDQAKAIAGLYDSLKKEENVKEEPR
jgi:hypothetical protein